MCRRMLEVVVPALSKKVVEKLRSNQVNDGTCTTSYSVAQGTHAVQLFR